MAIEARQINLLPSRDFKVNNQMDYGVNFPAAMAGNLLPFYQSSVCDPVKTESGVTYHLPAGAQRKRTRESFDELNALPVLQKTKLSGVSSFIDDHTIFQIQQHQSEIDRFVAEHAEKVRLELEERRKQESRMLVQEIYNGIQKKLKEKDEEIHRMAKLNWVLQERVKSLCVENQIWRELAQSNEAAANSLRTNLEQVLAHVADDRHSGAAVAEEADDAESCCGSSDRGAEEEDVEAMVAAGGGGGRRMCRKCGTKESCVLVLPCRHLCLCTMCGSTVHTCPLCNSAMNASVHVNMSS